MSCAGCSKAFTLIRRRHPCNECGVSMCKRCLVLLPSTYARTRLAKACGPCSIKILQERYSSGTDLRSVPEPLEQVFLDRSNSADTVHSTAEDEGSDSRVELESISADDPRLNEPTGNVADRPATPEPTSQAAASVSGPDGASASYNSQSGDFFAQQLLSLLVNSGSVSLDGLDGVAGGQSPQQKAAAEREQAKLLEQHKKEVAAAERYSALFAALTHEDLIENLTIKDLKIILDANRVDHAKFIEKLEYVNAVVHLWRAKNISGPHKEVETSMVCKVCLENEIDCVFLECGHLAACRLCGAHLTECPVCRQHITRLVDVFRS